MDFLESKAHDVYLLRIKVKTNSIKQEILSYTATDSWLTIKLKSKPLKNKANNELINLIKKRIDISAAQIHIISGLKKTHKTLEIKFFDNIGIIDIIKKLIG
jgi:uncharacterized protein (TIGR00251 family)